MPSQVKHLIEEKRDKLEEDVRRGCITRSRANEKLLEFAQFACRFYGC